jgi:type IV pilus assembly protein PilX
MLRQSKHNVTPHCMRGDCITNEAGAALVLSLVILLVLTFIGLGAMLSSTTELSLSGNYKLSKQAYYAAEGGTAYALRDNQYYFVDPADPVKPFPAGGVDLSVDGTTASGDVTLLASNQEPPQGMGFGMTVRANYFVVETSGRSTQGSFSRMQVYKAEIVPAGG